MRSLLLLTGFFAILLIIYGVLLFRARYRRLKRIAESTEEGTILVNDTPATVEGLFEALEAALSESREKLVILRGDKSVLLGQAVNILDLAQQAGATGIALATKPPAAEKG